LLSGPTLGSVKLSNNGLLLIDTDLVNSVFIAIEGQYP